MGNAKEYHDENGATDIVLKRIQSGGRITDPNFVKELDDILTRGTETSRSPELNQRNYSLQQLRALPRQAIGIRDEEIIKFLNKYNLRHSEYFVINFTDLPKEARSRLNLNVLGAYSIGLDVVILFADRILQTTNLIVDRESFLIHELAHSSAGGNGFRVASDIPPEKAQAGIFFEEGFADLFQRKYIAENGNLENHLAGTSGANLTMNSVFTIDQGVSFDGDRLFIDAKRRTSTSPSAFAGFGLELLCSAIPSLQKQLVKSRSNPEVFNEALASIDRYFPGLSKSLKGLCYNSKDFEAGNKLIVRAIYNKDIVETNKQGEPIVRNVTSIRFKLGKLFGQ